MNRTPPRNEEEGEDGDFDLIELDKCFSPFTPSELEKLDLGNFHEY